MPTDVKICGLSSTEGVDAALDAGAGYLGFVFFPPSPRNVAIDQAVPLIGRSRGKAAIVALLVDPDDRLVDDVVRTLDPDYLQLHGRESPERLASIASRAMIPVIKAVGIGSGRDLKLLGEYTDVADRLLLDAKAPRDATRPGGHGSVFDWSILEGFASPKPWFLSGGLNPENIGDALAATGATAVDVSSGVEGAPGRKDPARIRAFVDAVRAFDRPLRPARAEAAKERAL